MALTAEFDPTMKDSLQRQNHPVKVSQQKNHREFTSSEFLVNLKNLKSDDPWENMGKP